MSFLRDRSPVTPKITSALGPAMRGTTVIIGHGRHRISDLLEGRVACTRIGLA